MDVDLSRFTRLSDFENYARRKDELNQWCEMQATPNVRRSNLIPNTSEIDLTTTVKTTGFEPDMPIGVSAASSSSDAGYCAEVDIAKAAASSGCIHVCSTHGKSSLEEVYLSVEGGQRWLQLHDCRDRRLILSFARRAKAAGYKALVVQVDMQPQHFQRRQPKRRSLRQLKHNMSHLLKKAQPTDNEFPCTAPRPGLSWSEIDWLQDQTDLPVVLKGVLSADDAEMCLAHGIRSIMLDCRQLSIKPTMELLLDVAERVQERIEIFVERDFKTGFDILKALALGAKTVFLDRPISCGLQIAGEKGVEAVLLTAANELRGALLRTGSTLDSMAPDIVPRPSKKPAQNIQPTATFLL